MNVDAEYQGAPTILNGLKDFQKKTAAYAFQRMYTDPDAAHRFLIADEVGLGKTLVARGLIAQAIDHLQSHGERRIDIVYVCSNAAIARQNIRRLDVTESGTLDGAGADRLTMLPLHLNKLGKRGINLLPITPGTSFHLGRNLGKFTERALLFTLLRAAWGSERLAGSGPARLFYTGIDDSDPRNARRRLYRLAREYQTRIPPSFHRAFKAALVAENAARRNLGEPILQRELDSLAADYQYRGGVSGRSKARRSQFIGKLRQLVAECAIERLAADIVILDEFQRFKRLLDVDDGRWENRIARRLFNAKGAKTNPTRVLLMSATPYRMFTHVDDPDGDDHHEDLIHTVRFLFDDDSEADSIRETLRDLHRALLAADTQQTEQAHEACRELGARLRQVMVRTERLASDRYRDGMLIEHSDTVLGITPEDVRSFVSATRIAREVGVHTPMELWKSGPYLLNFLEGYAMRRKLDEKLDAADDCPQLRAAIETGHGLLPWNEVERYQPLDPGNARLRSLIDSTIERGLWRLLWLPPSMPYYRTDSEFDAPEAKTATKRLVFSGWRLVPRVVASITSYEAERRMVALGEKQDAYSTEFSDRSGRLLDFRMEGDRPASMTSLAFIYPSNSLADMGDVTELIPSSGALPHIDDVRDAVKSRIHSALNPHLNRAPNEGTVDQRWIWAAGLLLDRERDDTAWVMNTRRSQAWQGKESAETGLLAHLKLARNWLEDRPPLGRPPDDLLELLCDLALAGPANCAMRALRATLPTMESELIRDAAARIAWGFRALFNAPAETALVRSRVDAPYWRAALSYCADGNLQAVLDEYMHVLKEWTGNVDRGTKDVASVIAATAYRALTLRTTRYMADVPRIENGDPAIERHSLRGRFAVQYGDHRESDASTIRASHVSDAFNSPFWPFVLATTSIGQEGLDFHLYCHAVVHWNLPHNPVDLEQREGRVHRYKGHAVRKNLAVEYGGEAVRNRDPWGHLFRIGVDRRSEEENDLVPFWLFRPNGTGAAIERHVPMLPLSSEQSRFPALMRALAAYRLAFGQPRQEDLVRSLLERHDESEIDSLVKTLRVDLTPP